MLESFTRNMDLVMDQQLLNIIIMAAGGIAGFLLKVIWDAIQKLKDDLSALERNLASDYVRRNDYRDDMVEVKQMLHSIFDKLDSKVDK